MAYTLDDIKRIRDGVKTKKGDGASSSPSSDSADIERIKSIRDSVTPVRQRTVYDDYARMATQSPVENPTEPTYRYNSIDEYDKALSASPLNDRWSKERMGYTGKKAANAGINVFNHVANIGKYLNPSSYVQWAINGEMPNDQLSNIKYTPEEMAYEDLKTERNLYAAEHIYDERYKPVMNNADYKATVESMTDDDVYQWIKKHEFDTKDTSLTETYLRMTPEQKEVARYYMSKGEGEFQNYIRNMGAYVSKPYYEAVANDIKEYADSNGNDAVITAATTPLKQIGNFAPLEYAQSALYGTTPNPYGGISSIGNIAQEAQNYVAEDLTERYGDVAGKGYQIGTSMLDSYIGGKTFGKAYAPLMSGGVYNTTYKELTERGADSEEALYGALLAGGAEWAFETISLENLLKPKNPATFKQLLMEYAKQSGIEASEEYFTELANIMSEELVQGTHSEIQQMITKMRNDGKSEDEIKAEVSKYVTRRAGEAAIGGAISGGGLSMLMNTSYYADNVKVGKNTDRQALSDAISKLNPNSETYKKYNGKDLSSLKESEVGAIVKDAYNEASKLDRDRYRNALIDALEAEGFNEDDAAEYADAIVAEKKSPVQKLMLKDNAIVENITRDVNNTVGVQMLVEADNNARQIARTVSDRTGIAKYLKKSNLKVGARTELNGEEVKVKDAIKDGDTIKIITENGEANPKELTLSANDAAMVAAASGIDNEVKRQAYFANYDGVQNVAEYTESFDAAYRYGRLGMSEEQLTEDLGKSIHLTAEQAVNAFVKGQNEANTTSEKLDESLKSATKELEGFRKGKLTFDNVDVKSLNATQRGAVVLAEAFNNMGINVVLFNDSSDDSENGRYENGTVYINLSARYYKNAIKFDKGYVINTMAHELTHWMEDTAKTEFKALKKAIFDFYGEEKTKELIAKEQQRQEGLSDRAAESEVVARACEDMLSNADTLEKIMMGIDTNTRQTIIDKFKEFFEKLGRFLKNALLINSQSDAARMLRENAEVFEQVRQQWIKTFTEAVNTVQTDSKTLEEAHIDILDDGIAYNKKTLDESWLAANNDEEVEKVGKVVSKYLGVSVEKGKEYVRNLHTIAAIEADNEALQYEDTGLSSWVSNSDYGGNFDFSFLCPKRLVYTGTVAEIRKHFRKALSPTRFLAIRRFLINRGYDAPCSFCYVESGRVNADKYIQKFISENPQYNFTLSQLANPDSLEALRSEYVTTGKDNGYRAFEKYMNKLAQRKPKALEKRRAYRGEILNNNEFNAEKVATINYNEGVRFFAFSDFEVPHMLDMMQVITDMSVRGLYGFAYTKQKAFVEIFGKTGLKINMSCVAKGVDENGKIIFDDVEGMNHEDALRLRNNDCGIVCVVFTNEQLKAALADDRIDYVLPFHRSQYNKNMYHMMGLPEGTRDFTIEQTEKQGDESSKKTETNIPTKEFWDYTKSGRENAQRYLDIINERGMTPLFRSVLEYEGGGIVKNEKGRKVHANGKWVLPEGAVGDGYYKVLIEQRMYDDKGNATPQRGVTPDFNMEAATQIAEEFDENPNTFPVAHDVVDDFLKWEKSGEPLFSTKVDSVSDAEYESLVKTNPAEARRILEETARAHGYNSPLLYHGTKSFGFTEFNKFDDGFSIFLTDNEDVAYSYAGEYVKPISPKERIDVDNASFEEVLDAYNNTIGRHSRSYKEVTKEDLQKERDKFAEYIAELANNTKLVTEHSYKDFEEIINRTNEKITEKGFNRFIDLNKNLYNLYNEYASIKDNDSKYNKWKEDVINARTEIELSGVSDFIQRMMAILRNDTEFLIYTSRKEYVEHAFASGERVAGDNGKHGYLETESTIRERIKERQEGKAGQGTYALYAKLGKSLVVDGDERFWDELPVPKEMRKEYEAPYATTRDIAEFAHNHGYDSVIFEGITDVSSEAYDYYESDVYDIFDPKNIASADLITRDDDGNVIPLSKRFTDNPDIRYSSKVDSEGNNLTDQQIKYFSKSEIRDDDGNLLVVYHGTPSGGFTVFNGAMNYFTANKAYAERYTRGSGSGRRGDNPQMYKGYLNIVKPFTLSDPEAKRIYIDEYIKGGYAQGINPLSSKAEIEQYAQTIDWVEADNLKEFFEEKGYDYDGFVLNEGGDLTDNGTVMRGDSYVTFASNQFKNIENKNPTTNPDIRYSLKDIGYHAGDLGKAESLSQQGGSRDTGHFGTGTYFVGDEEQINSGTYGKRPHEKVDFSKYNLYRPLTSDEGFKVHRFLRGVDGYAYTPWDSVDSEDAWDEMFDNILDSIYEGKYDATDVYKKLENLFGYGLSDAISKASDWEYSQASDGTWYWNDYHEVSEEEVYKNVDVEKVVDRLNDRYTIRYARERADRFGEWKQRFLDARFAFGVSEEKLQNIFKEVQKEIAEFKGDESVADSAATRFMKKLGYEGVDVRGIKGLDNTMYGSVIYDLKGEDLERKKEIGTARFSYKVDDETADIIGLNKALEEQNKKLKADVDRLNKRLKLEKTITKGKVMKDSDLETVAGMLLREVKSKADKAEVIEGLRDVYGYILDKSNEGIVYDEMMSKAYDVAKLIMNEAKPAAIIDDYFKGIMEDIRRARIKLTPEQIQEAKYTYGKQWRNTMMGRITTVNDGRSLDSYWQEWAEMYPNVFDVNTNPNDQLVELSQIYDDLKDASVTMQRFNTHADIMAMAEEVYDKFWNIRTETTTADKHDAEIKKLKFEHRKAMAELKDRQKLLDDMYYGRKIAEYKHRDVKKDAEIVRLKNQYGKMIEKIRERSAKREADLKQFMKDRDARLKNNAERRKLISKITEVSEDLSKRLLKGEKGKKVPQALKAPLAELLTAIDFSSKQLLGINAIKKAGIETKRDIAMSALLNRVSLALQGFNDAKAEGDDAYDLAGLHLPPNYATDLQEIADTIATVEQTAKGSYVLQYMTAEQLDNLYKAIKAIRTAINNVNKIISTNNAHEVDYLGNEIMTYLDKLGQRKIDNKVTQFMEVANKTPYYFFKHMGRGGQELFSFLQNGWDKLADNVEVIKNFTRGTKKDGSDALYTSQEYEKWRNTVHQFDVLEAPTPDERAEGKAGRQRHITMTEAQIMALYCLSKREQAMLHISRDGIVIDEIKTKKKYGKHEIKKQDTVTLAPTDLGKILSVVTSDARMKQVADKIQEFMNTVCAEWGNEVTMKLYGTEEFTEKNYFPIHVNQEVLSSEAKNKSHSIYGMLNQSFTKPLNDKARNEINIADIFDVFNTHASDMAKYNALALPIMDVIKVWNYKENLDRGDNGQREVKAVKKSITKAIGKAGNSYISGLLRDLNGDAESGRYDKTSMRLVKNYKTAAVAANIQTALLQPLAYIRAGYMVNPKYLRKALTRKPKINECIRDLGVQKWKSMGFYDTNLTRGLDKIISNSDSLFDTIVDKSLWLTEKMDEVTWGYLYTAVELETKDKYPSLSGEKLKEQTIKRLRDVVYGTQVFDSTLARTAMMRSTSALVQMETSFGAEPILSVNMLMDAATEFNQEARRTDFATAVSKKGKLLARASAVYLVASVVESALRAALKRIRDYDDEDDTFEGLTSDILERTLEELDVLNKIPWVKEAMPYIRKFVYKKLGFEEMSKSIYADNSRMDTEVFATIDSAIKSIDKALEGENLTYKDVQKISQALSQTSGLPISNVIKEFKVVWNNTVGRITGNTIR